MQGFLESIWFKTKFTGIKVSAHQNPLFQLSAFFYIHGTMLINT